MGRDEENVACYEPRSDKTWRATSLAAAAYRHTRVPTYLLGAALTIALLVVGSSSSSRSPAVAKTSESARLRYKDQTLEEYGRILREANDVLDAYKSKTGDAQSHGEMEGVEGDALSAPASDRGNLRDLVIGMAKDIEAIQVAVFTGSWREWSGAGTSDIVLLINDPISKEMEAVLQRFEVTPILFQEETLLPKQLRRYHPSSYRWPLINDYLRKHSGKYGRVLMADIRDTAFQKNPLDAIVGAYDGEERLYTFHGVERKTIGKCGWNGGWVKDCFGDAVLQSLFDKPIICSGISMGTIHATEEYVALMTQNVLSPFFKQCERNGADQGVHNVLVHRGDLPHVHVQDQRHGLVVNMQARIGTLLKPEFQVVNQDAALYAVVHQYDRVPELARFYVEKFVFWKSDLTDATNACEGFQLYQEMDLFKAECDLRTVAAMDHSACCVLCNRDPKCGGFTQYGSMCYLKTCTTAGKNSQALSEAVSGVRVDTQVDRKV